MRASSHFIYCLFHVRLLSREKFIFAFLSLVIERWEVKLVGIVKIFGTMWRKVQVRNSTHWLHRSWPNVTRSTSSNWGCGVGFHEWTPLWLFHIFKYSTTLKPILKVICSKVVDISFEFLNYHEHLSNRFAWMISTTRRTFFFSGFFTMSKFVLHILLQTWRPPWRCNL